MANKIHRFNTLDGHGLKTLTNGLNNTRMFIICHWGFIGLILLSNHVQVVEISNFLKLIWRVYILLSMSSYSYKISEIKHLSDGVSKTLESDMFFIKYSIFGVLGILFDITLLILLRSNVIELIIILILLMSMFLLGMGDLAQVTHINKFSLKQNLLEPFRFFIEVPTNIIKAIFMKKHRRKFQNTLRHNLTHIFKGMKIAISKLKLSH